MPSTQREQALSTKEENENKIMIINCRISMKKKELQKQSRLRPGSLDLDIVEDPLIPHHVHPQAQTDD